MTARVESRRQNVVCGIVLLLQHSYKHFRFFLPSVLVPFILSASVSFFLPPIVPFFFLLNTIPTGFVVNFKHCLYENRKRNEVGPRSSVIAELVSRGLFTCESGT